MAWKALTDEQWKLIKPLIPKQKMGRPRTRDRAILDAILWILSSGLRWNELDSRFPLKSTIYDRFKVWLTAGFFEELFKTMVQLKPASDLYFLDATIKSSKKGRSRFTSRQDKGKQNKPGRRRSRVA